jgi:CrcB protein
MRVWRDWSVLAVVAVGGVLGSFGRYGLAVWIPRSPTGFPWATFLTNSTGCLLIGVLMVLVTEVWSANPYVRPFLGVGVLGGFTTFSTYAVETRGLFAGARPALAFAYLAGSLISGLAAVAVGVAIGRAYARWRRPGPELASGHPEGRQVAAVRLVADEESGVNRGIR